MLTRFDLSRAGIIAIVAGMPALASAQMKDVAPYPAVVIVSAAELHSGDTAQHYRVGAVNQNVIVIVDGESANWSRVSYPAGSYAFVPADDASFDAAANEIKLIKESRLRAPNPTSGYTGSWKALLVTALPAGTTMKVLQVEEAGKGGGALAYRVGAPANARAFTESKNLRKASAEEIAAFRAKGGSIPENLTPAPVAVAPSTPASTPLAAPSTASSTPAPASTAPATPVDNSLVKPVNTAGTNGAPAAPANTTQPAPAPASTAAAPGSSTPSAAPVTIDQSASSTSGTAAPAATSTPASTPAPVVAAPSPTMRNAARIKELDQAFDRVNAQPLGEAEYETLIAEYERTIQTLSGQLSPRQRALLEQRLNILKFRKDLRQQQLALLNESSTTQQQNQQVLQNVAQVEATRVYSIVGQLQPSTVYNGQTLPLMYRIQSVGTSVPRTLGYIKPDPKFALDSKLGQIVGVIGESSVDRELKLNVITPVRIDLLQGIPMQAAPQAPVQIPQAPSGQVPPVQMPEQQQPPKPSTIEVTK